MRSSWKLIVTPLVFFSLIILFFSGCDKETHHTSETDEHGSEHSQEIVLKPDIIQEIGLELASPKKEVLQQYFTAQGKVVVNPDYVAHINTLVSGRIQKVYVQIGDYVKQDQPLFALESLEIAIITADFIRTKAELEVQKLNYERIKELRQQNIKAEKDLIAAKADYQRAMAEWKAADRKLHSVGFDDEEAEQLFNNHSHEKGVLFVKSPINGIVTERNIELGQLLNPETDAMKVIDITKIWVEAEVYEKDYIHLKVGQNVRIHIPTLPGKVFMGKVSNVNKALDDQSRTFKVFINVLDGKKEMVPNMFASVDFIYGDGKAVLTLPQDAIQFDGTTQFVFIEDEPNTFLKKVVVLGQKVGEFYEIKSGISENDKVAVKGAFYLKSELEKEKFGEGHAH